MKKIIFALIALMCSMSINAQIMKVLKNGKVVKAYYAIEADEVVFESVTPAFLPGEFSVSDTKKVKFTRSNLYWDGYEFRFEAKQTDYQTSWNTKHVSHFYWQRTQTTSYATTYNDGNAGPTDVPFFAESHGLTVEGTPGLYVLSKDEWSYLINTRTNATNLKKTGVTVDVCTNCLIIAPNDFTGTLKSSYTLDEINTLGLVCLPAAGTRDGSSLKNGGSSGSYWSSSPNPDYFSFAISLVFSSGSASIQDGFRKYGESIRLVGNIQ